MRIGLDVHVLHGAAQGTSSIWRNLIPALPRDNTYILYSFDPAATRSEFPYGRASPDARSTHGCARPTSAAPSGNSTGRRSR